MASDGAKKLVKYMQESGICSNPSLFGTLEEDFEGFLTNAKPVLSEFVHRDYKLEQHHTTYKLRYKLVKCFIEKKKSERLRLTSVSQSKEFFVELKQFADDSESEEDLSDLDLDQGRQDRVRGVVVWKSNKTANARVKEDHRRQGDSGSFSLSELSVNFLNENDTDHEGFHLQLAVGDIVEVTKCSRKDGIALEQDIEKCCLSDTKIESFLRHLSNYAKNNGSSATAIEITRFSTFWEYILNLSKDKLTNEIILQILEIINKVCFVVPMSLTVIAIVQGFQQSMLFRSVLPNFNNELTVEDVKSHISILQKILEHVITAVPASGLQVLQMATDLAHNLVMGSNELEAKESGLSAIEFLSKLCSIIASKEDGLQVYQVCPPAGTFYMQPLVQEDGLQVYQVCPPAGTFYMQPLVQEDGLQVYQVCPPAGTFYMQPLVQPGQPVFFMQQMRSLWQPMQQLQQMRTSGMQVSGDGQIPRAKGIHQVPPRQMPGQQQQLPYKPSYKLQQPQPHPSTAPMQQQERFQPSICIPGQEPLYRSVMASVSLAEQKQMPGERLFPLIQATYPDQAGKITGMLLEIDNSELLHMLECREALDAKTQEAVSVLKAHNARMEEAQFDNGV